MGNKIASRLPYLALLAVCVASLGARAAWIGLPCHASCRAPAAHLLIFDERYYVNAARVIAGIRPPAVPGATYRHAPLGSDPNAEHPQLAKLIMAGSIELLGDGPWAWRLGSLIFGTLAIVGMFVLVRAAGGGQWLSVAAATLMAADNMMLVQGRIATLEIYVVAAMVWSVALYMRGHPLMAGLAAGVGACMKLFALDVVPVLVLLELLGHSGIRAGSRQRLGHLALAIGTTAASFIGLLEILDRIAPPYDNAAARNVGGGPFDHLAHMISYGVHQTGIARAHGIASYPWQWIVDSKPIVYLSFTSSPPRAFAGDHPAVHFLGLISPPILLACVVGTSLALWQGRWARGVWTRLISFASAPATDPARERNLLNVAAAWFLGTFGPFTVASLAFDRTAYLYYMTIVMPGMYIAAVWLADRLRRHMWLVSLWAAAVVAGAVVLYPFTPLP